MVLNLNTSPHLLKMFSMRVPYLMAQKINRNANIDRIEESHGEKEKISKWLYVIRRFDEVL